MALKNLSSSSITPPTGPTGTSSEDLIRLSGPLTQEAIIRQLHENFMDGRCYVNGILSPCAFFIPLCRLGLVLYCCVSMLSRIPALV